MSKKYDREYLVNKIAMMRIKGKSTRFLLEFLQEKVGMPQSTAYTVLRDAQENINQMQEKKIEDAYADALARLEDLYEESNDKKIKEFENNILKEVNKTGIGPGGFGGKITALDVKVLTYPCHIASLPVAVNINCHASRHITIEI